MASSGIPRSFHFLSAIDEYITTSFCSNLNSFLQYSFNTVGAIGVQGNAVSSLLSPFYGPDWESGSITTGSSVRPLQHQ